MKTCSVEDVSGIREEEVLLWQRPRFPTHGSAIISSLSWPLNAMIFEVTNHDKNRISTRNSTAAMILLPVLLMAFAFRVQS